MRWLECWNVSEIIKKKIEIAETCQLVQYTLLYHFCSMFSPDLSNKNVLTQACKHLNIKWILKSNHSCPWNDQSDWVMPAIFIQRKLFSTSVERFLVLLHHTKQVSMLSLLNKDGKVIGPPLGGNVPWETGKQLWSTQCWSLIWRDRR